MFNFNIDSINVLNSEKINFQIRSDKCVDFIFNIPNVANLGFWKIWLILSLWVRQLHFNTENTYAQGLTGGGLSIPLSNLSCFNSYEKKKFVN